MSLDSANPEVRTAALRALGLIADHDPRARAAVTPHLRRGLFDGVVECQQEAIRAVSVADVDDWGEVESFLGSDAWALRFAAVVALSYRGRPLHPDDVATTLRDVIGTWHELQVTPLFDQVRDPAQRALLAPFLASGYPMTRFLAEEASARLDAIAMGAAADWQPASQQARERFNEQTTAARERLRGEVWYEATRAELLAAVSDARFVLFAESLDWDYRGRHSGGSTSCPDR